MSIIDWTYRFPGVQHRCPFLYSRCLLSGLNTVLALFSFPFPFPFHFRLIAVFDCRLSHRLNDNTRCCSIETGFAPAAYHAMEWGPVETSAVLGSISLIILLMMFVVFELSRCKVKDEYILAYGLVQSIIGYSLIWFQWVAGGRPWQFIVPILISVSSFPFLAAPTRSLFTKAVDNIEALEGHQGTMQAVLSMAASVAGFTAPSLVAAFVLKHPSVVGVTTSSRELSKFALVAPALSGVVLIGIIIIQCRSAGTENKTEDGVDTVVDTVADTEASRLLSATEEEDELADKTKKRQLPPGKLPARIQFHRHDSVKLMGISQGNIHHEHHGHDDHDGGR